MIALRGFGFVGGQRAKNLLEAATTERFPWCRSSPHPPLGGADLRRFHLIPCLPRSRIGEAGWRARTLLGKPCSMEALVGEVRRCLGGPSLDAARPDPGRGAPVRAIMQVDRRFTLPMASREVRHVG
jgi:hypothetical protein